MQISFAVLASLPLIPLQIGYINWNEEIKGRVWLYFFSAFLIRGSILKWEPGSCLWENEQFSWVFSIFFLYHYSQNFFGCFGLCFRKQVDLLASWFAPALTCMNFNTSNLVHFNHLLGLPYDWCDTFCPALGTDGGHHDPLLSLSALWEQTFPTCPASSISLHILQFIT